jgi:Transcriptional Coactivator p15 (PC4)
MDETPDTNGGGVIATFEKNKKEEVRLSIESYHGRKIINFRVFYKDDTGAWKPGKQGLALAVDRYKDLADAVLQLGQCLKTDGLL